MKASETETKDTKPTRVTDDGRMIKDVVEVIRDRRSIEHFKQVPDLVKRGKYQTKKK